MNNDKNLLNEKINLIIENTYRKELQIKESIKNINLNNLKLSFDLKKNLIGGQTEEIRFVVQKFGNGKWNSELKSWEVSQVFFNIMHREYHSRNITN